MDKPPGAAFNGTMDAMNDLPVIGGEVRDYMRTELMRRGADCHDRCLRYMESLCKARTVCFALDTALALLEVEQPRCAALPGGMLRVVVRTPAQRSLSKVAEYRCWQHPYECWRLNSGVVCMAPVDVWIHYAQYLDVVELVVLAEAIARRWSITGERFAQRLESLRKVTGRRRCLAALGLMASSDSVQETRTRLVLRRNGLPECRTGYVVEDCERGMRYVVDMAYPERKVAIEYDGDHHRRFRSQYVRDQRKRDRLRQLGWTVIVVFADDLSDMRSQRRFVAQVAEALGIPVPGCPARECRCLADPRLAVNARRHERERLASRRRSMAR